MVLTTRNTTTSQRATQQTRRQLFWVLVLLALVATTTLCDAATDRIRGASKGVTERLLKDKGDSSDSDGKKGKNKDSDDSSDDESDDFKNNKKGSKDSSKGNKGGKKNNSNKGAQGRFFGDKCDAGTIVVANRGDGTITVLDASDGEAIETFELPYNEDTELQPEPVDIVAVNGMYFVGDRANNRVLAFDGYSNELIKMIPAGAGIYEMATDARGTQLWVNNQIDNTTTIIDLNSLTPIRTIEAPVTVGNAVVNDVVLSPSGDVGFVTYNGDGGAIVQYNAATGAQTAINTADVGDNLRATLSFRFNCLYAPSTSSDQLHVLFTGDLFQEATFPFADPFDGVTTPNGSYGYFTSTVNDNIRVLDIANNTLIDGAVPTPVVNPTKLAVTGNRLFVAHTDSDMVTIYSISPRSPVPILIDAIDVGDAPFGIAHCAPLRPELC